MNLKRWMFIGGGCLLALGGLGFLVAASGVVSTKASSGHWKITEWFLHFSMKRSASTYSLGVTVPSLDGESLIVQGARYYEFGCRGCHGAPGASPTAVTRSMLPPPPDLVAAVPASNPKRLFHIVKHGVKFTGMPAFPSQQRDDEVWAVVAFLMKLPELDAAGYSHLAATGDSGVTAEEPLQPSGPEDRAFAKINRTCQQCHGPDGLGTETIPRIAGQRPEYLLHALNAYKDGRRHSGMMQPAAASLEETAIRQLVTHYANLRATRSSGKTIEPAPTATASTEPDAAKIERGRLLAHEGIRERRLPACIECHDPDGHRISPAHPSLAGQPAGYLASQLELFKTDRRGGSAFAHLMQPIAARLEPAEMEAVAAYFASLPPADPADAAPRATGSARPD